MAKTARPPLPGSRLTLRVPRGFDLRRAVCSYGYFLLAPNLWDPTSRTLHRPLRVGNGNASRLVHVAITQPPRSRQALRLACDRRVDRYEATSLRGQVGRMLRTEEDLRAWRRMHGEARAANFGRMFRSPTLFEDIIKTITGQNVSWGNTIRMNRLLVEHLGGGGFPTPARLAAVEPARLNELCRVGYRDTRIVRLARDVVSGEIDLDWFDHAREEGQPSDDVFARFKSIHGLGDYAAANLCMCVGYYDRLAIDTETYRHYCLTRGVKRPKDPKPLHSAIEAEYGKYAPYHFLAYWYELWVDYQRRFGPAWAWEGKADGPSFTAANLREPVPVTKPRRKRARPSGNGDDD